MHSAVRGASNALRPVDVCDVPGIPAFLQGALHHDRSNFFPPIRASEPAVDASRSRLDRSADCLMGDRFAGRMRRGHSRQGEDDRAARGLPGQGSALRAGGFAARGCRGHCLRRFEARSHGRGSSGCRRAGSARDRSRRHGPSARRWDGRARRASRFGAGRAFRSRCMGSHSRERSASATRSSRC